MAGNEKILFGNFIDDIRIRLYFQERDFFAVSALTGIIVIAVFY
jgi:hypothetical protein